MTCCCFAPDTQLSKLGSTIALGSTGSTFSCSWSAVRFSFILDSLYFTTNKAKVDMKLIVGKKFNISATCCDLSFRSGSGHSGHSDSEILLSNTTVFGSQPSVSVLDSNLSPRQSSNKQSRSELKYF